jgi:hypothetical protein
MNSVQPDQFNTDVAILVASSDSYHDLWHPFFDCFFKYWPDCPYRIYLGSNYKTYNDSRVEPILVGEDIDYSTNLGNMLKQLKENWVILWIEDRVISARVRTDQIQSIARFAQDQNAVFVKLIASHPYAVEASQLTGFGEIQKGAKYRVCITIALWRKDALQIILIPGETAWQLERKGSQRSVYLAESFYSLVWNSRQNPPIRDVHLVVKGRLVRDALAFIEKQGLRRFLDGRQVQSWGSYLYTKGYILAWDTYAFARQKASHLKRILLSF